MTSGSGMTFQKDEEKTAKEPAPSIAEEYRVERIIDMRIRNDDKAEYLLKWHGYDETFNSWEPEENLNCPKLLDKFKRKRKKEQRKKKKAKWGEEKVAQKLDDKNNEDSALSKEENQMKGLEPEQIIGATDSPGELWFLIKWKHSDVANLIPARLANERYPETVMKFYEERIVWLSPSEDASDGENIDEQDESSLANLAISGKAKPKEIVRKDNLQSGFERGLESSKIFGATKKSGELMFFTSWKNGNELDLVPAQLIVKRYPKIVLEFFQKQLMWPSARDTGNKEVVTRDDI